MILLSGYMINSANKQVHPSAYINQLVVHMIWSICMAIKTTCVQVQVTLCICIDINTQKCTWLHPSLYSFKQHMYQCSWLYPSTSLTNKFCRWLYPSAWILTQHIYKYRWLDLSAWILRQHMYKCRWLHPSAYSNQKVMQMTLSICIYIATK